MVLNEKQVEAVKHFNGPMMVLAGPGSGKTTVITYRVKHLIDTYKIKPEKILVIAFTKASSVEMDTRFKSITQNNSVYEGASFGTFHSFFFRIIRSVLGYKLESVLKEEERKLVLKNIINEFKIEYEYEDEFIKDILASISLMRNELIDLKYYNSMVCSDNDFKTIFNKYEEYKKTNNKIDFDDMLYICWKILKTNKLCLNRWQKKYDFILIDEFQDSVTRF